eukprot:TRINITY_DN5547_c0_g1_i6.p1 TRINITY_DN5547_c0_g1~~TRINITY_DN5547_c0_g1_i6.p1  ORF type:complete len:131 (-),score=5.21 TRINITY_DN5547_c0_g1_i6:562-930(-)
MIRRPPRSTPLYSSAASDVYKRQANTQCLLKQRNALVVEAYSVEPSCQYLRRALHIVKPRRSIRTVTVCFKGEHGIGNPSAVIFNPKFSSVLFQIFLQLSSRHSPVIQKTLSPEVKPPSWCS